MTAACKPAEAVWEHSPVIYCGLSLNRLQLEKQKQNLNTMEQQAGSHQTALLPPVQPPSFLTPCTKMEEVKPGHSLPTSYLPTWALVHYIHYIWFITLHSSVHRVRTVPCVVSGGLPHFDPTPCVFFVHMIGRSKLDVIFYHVSCVYPCPICTWKNSLGSYTGFKLLGFNPPPSPKLYISPLNPHLFLRACETMGRWPGHPGTV